MCNPADKVCLSFTFRSPELSPSSLKSEHHFFIYLLYLFIYSFQGAVQEDWRVVRVAAPLEGLFVDCKRLSIFSTAHIPHGVRDSIHGMESSISDVLQSETSKPEHLILTF